MRARWNSSWGRIKGIGLAVKLGAMIIAMMSIMAVLLVWYPRKMEQERIHALMRKMAQTASKDMAIQSYSDLMKFKIRAGLLGSIWLNASQDKVPLTSRTAATDYISSILDNEPEFLGVIITGATESDSLTQFSSQFVAKGVDSPDFKRWIDLLKSEGQAFVTKSLTPRDGIAGKLRLRNMPPVLDIPQLLAVEGVLMQGEARVHVWCLVSADYLLKYSGKGESVAGYLIWEKGGEIAAKSDSIAPELTHALAQSWKPVSELEGVIGESRVKNQNRFWLESTRSYYTYSVEPVGSPDLYAVAVIPEARFQAAGDRIYFKTALLGGIVLLVSVLGSAWFARGISRPISQMADAAQAIAHGDFDVKLSIERKDEVGVLARAFNRMSQGLVERNRIREMFQKFHDQELAERLMSGEAKLGGERREAVIFFSDVRGFTSMAESMEPEEVVEMLNEYMDCMVRVIRAHHGVVDKYVGDSIMAIWGIPMGSPDDALQSVKACLKMREELEKLNQRRLAREQNILKIGMGLNMGPVIAGNIGCSLKMEYTVIGDTVNLASRIQSMTKHYGTDFLVSKEIFEKVRGHFVFEKCDSTRVPGRNAIIEVYKVLGYVTEEYESVLIETPYSSFESDRSTTTTNLMMTLDETTEVTKTFSGFVYPVDEPGLGGTAEESAEWYLRLGEERMGPFTHREVLDGMIEETWTRQTLCQADGEGVWTPIAEHPAFIQQQDSEPKLNAA